MKVNLALWDRIFRYILGITLMTWAIAGGPWWCYSGAYFILTAAWGLCPTYAYFKVRTFHDKSQTQRRESI